MASVMQFPNLNGTHKPDVGAAATHRLHSFSRCNASPSPAVASPSSPLPLQRVNNPQNLVHGKSIFPVNERSNTAQSSFSTQTMRFLCIAKNERTFSKICSMETRANLAKLKSF